MSHPDGRPSRLSDFKDWLKMKTGKDGTNDKRPCRPVKDWIIYPFLLTLDTLEMFLARQGSAALFKVLAGLVVFWFFYVPAHELLHAAACFLTGGEVRQLALEPWYGAVILEKIFPFVVSGSDYAGQLTDFSVPGRFAYLVVDLFPYLPSLFGVALILRARRKEQALLFGPALLLTFVPLMSIPGDYYEAASLFTSPALAALAPGSPADLLVSDDAVKLFFDLKAAGHMDLLSLSLYAAGLAFGALLALGTLVLQVLIVRDRPNPLDKTPLKR